MSGPQDVGIRNRGKASGSARYSSPAISPTSELDDDHVDTSHPVRDTYLYAVF